MEHEKFFPCNEEDILRRVIGHEMKRSTLKETSLCEYCRLFPKGDFLSGVSSKRGEENNNARNLMIGSWCGACGHPSGSASGCVSKLTFGLSCFFLEWKLRQLDVCIEVGRQLEKEQQLGSDCWRVW